MRNRPVAVGDSITYVRYCSPLKTCLDYFKHFECWFGHLLYLFRAILSSDAKTRAPLGTNVCLDICAIVQVTSIIVMYTTVCGNGS